MNTKYPNHIRSARDSITTPSGLLQLSFLRLTSEVLQEAIFSDKTDIDYLKQELSLIENASLYIHRSKNTVHFCCRSEGSSAERGITQDRDRIYALARRAYLQARVCAMENNVRRLQKVLDISDGLRDDRTIKKKLERYADAGLDLSRIIFTKEQNEWIDQTFTPNPYHPEDLRYPTAGGIFTRSKSEAFIGSTLEGLGLPYRSDDLVTIIYDPRGNKPFRDTYFADFKVPNLLGGITVHEHLGAFQMESYSENALKRLNDYHNFTVCELSGRPVKTDEFTWSFESDLRSEKMTTRLIRKILLPGI